RAERLSVEYQASGDPPTAEDRPRTTRGGRRRPGSGHAGGAHLEGDPRHVRLYRVRPVPERLPRMEHRQAAVTEAADHEPAGPRVRPGPEAARRSVGERRRGGGAARAESERGGRRGDLVLAPVRGDHPARTG